MNEENNIRETQKEKNKEYRKIFDECLERRIESPNSKTIAIIEVIEQSYHGVAHSIHVAIYYPDGNVVCPIVTSYNISPIYGGKYQLVLGGTNYSVVQPSAYTYGNGQIGVQSGRGCVEYTTNSIVVDELYIKQLDIKMYTKIKNLAKLNTDECTIEHAYLIMGNSELPDGLKTEMTYEIPPLPKEVDDDGTFWTTMVIVGVLVMFGISLMLSG